MEALEHRIARIEARADIGRLISDYCRLCDSARLDALVRLFAADAVVTVPTFGVTAVGHAAIAAFYSGQFSAIERSFHWTHDAAVDFIRDDQAVGRVSAHAEIVLAGTTYLAAVQYDDCYTRDETTWRFGSRVLEFLYYAPLAELAQRFASPHSVQTAAGWTSGYRPAG